MERESFRLLCIQLWSSMCVANSLGPGLVTIFTWKLNWWHYSGSNKEHTHILLAQMCPRRHEMTRIPTLGGSQRHHLTYCLLHTLVTHVPNHIKLCAHTHTHSLLFQKQWKSKMESLLAFMCRAFNHKTCDTIWESLSFSWMQEKVYFLSSSPSSSEFWQKSSSVSFGSSVLDSTTDWGSLFCFSSFCETAFVVRV